MDEIWAALFDDCLNTGCCDCDFSDCFVNDFTGCLPFSFSSGFAIRISFTLSSDFLITFDLLDNLGDKPTIALVKISFPIPRRYREHA